MITEQQRKDRQLGIGGSDIAIILGLSSYKTPYQLYLEKIGESSEEQETPQQYWGNRLEPIIRDEFAKRHNVAIKTPDTTIHPFHEFLRANVDGFIPDLNAVLEVKTSSGFMTKQWGDNGSDNIPIQYLVQVAHYCSVFDADCAYIAVLIGGSDYREYKYTRNFEIESRIIEAAKAFWKCVQERTPPLPINQIDLRIMYPKHNPEKIKTIAPYIKTHLTELSDIKLKIKELGEIEEKKKFNIMRFMEDAECLTDEAGEPLITWKANKRGSRQFLIKGAN
jgi:putative phage-type endonuclease